MGISVSCLPSHRTPPHTTNLHTHLLHTCLTLPSQQIPFYTTRLPVLLSFPSSPSLTQSRLLRLFRLLPPSHASPASSASSVSIRCESVAVIWEGAGTGTGGEEDDTEGKANEEREREDDTEGKANEEREREDGTEGKANEGENLVRRFIVSLSMKYSRSVSTFRSIYSQCRTVHSSLKVTISLRTCHDLATQLST